MEQNSKEAYKEIQDELGEKQRRVLEYIRNHPNVTYNDVCRGLDWRTNSTTARIKELREMGYIIKSGDREDPITKHRCATYRVREEGEEKELVAKKAPVKHQFTISKEHLNALIGLCDTTKDIFKFGYSSTDTIAITLPNGHIERMLVVQGDGYMIGTTPNRNNNRIVFMGEDSQCELMLAQIIDIWVADSQRYAIVQTPTTHMRIWID